MDKRHRLSISFKQENRHIFEHLKGISNKSDYISKAITAYMSGEHSSIPYEEIRKIVMEILQNNVNLSAPVIHPPPPRDYPISDQDAELISQLF